MKIAKLLFPLIVIVPLLTYLSCGNGDDEFGEDTFNLDTLIITPSANIDNAFSIGWGVTTVGYPSYFVDIFYSSDELIDESDLLISTTSSVDAFPELNKPDETQYYRIENGPTAGLVLFKHNEDTPDPTDGDWSAGVSAADPAGTGKFLIGRFYHTAGLQITVARTRLAIPVSFQ